MHIEGRTGAGDYTPIVFVDGRRLEPGPSLRVINHSPDGFAWGYAGSGPAQLALALLLAAGVPPDRAALLHQRFKFDHIVPLPFDRSFAIDLDMPAIVAELEAAAGLLEP